MNEAVSAAITDITKSNSRKSLYHFTRARNLAAIFKFDALLSSSRISRSTGGERRAQAKEMRRGGVAVTINAHLKITESMIDPSTTQEQFRACLDRHVFFWPTLSDCRKMMEAYSRREPGERFAVLEFDAYALLSGHYSAVKLSKYDSGSSPRYPGRCSYRKKPEMWLPLENFKRVASHDVPVKASEIREVLIEDRVAPVSKHLIFVWTDEAAGVPHERRELVRPLTELWSMKR